MDSPRERGGGCWLRRVALERARSESRSRCEGSLGAESLRPRMRTAGPAPHRGRQRSGREAGSRPLGKPRFYRQQYPSGSGTLPRCLGEGQRVTHRVSPPLSHLRSTAETINSVTAPLRLSAQRHAHAETLVSKGPSAKLPPRPPEDFRSSGTASDWRRHTSRQYLILHWSPVCQDSSRQFERGAVLGRGERS